MPSTLEALGVIVLAVLPGALYTWALEREAGNWGVGLSDRVLRFVGASAIFQAGFLYFGYRIWIAYVRRPEIGPDGEVEFRNLFLEGAGIPGWVWLVPVVYVGLPIAAGTVAGLSVNRWPRISRVLVGRDPAPRGWDFLFSPRPAGLVRTQLKDGTWVGDLFAANSYAAGYPEEPQDIYLEGVWEMGDDGRFIGVIRDEDFVSHGSLIRWDEIKALEFLHLPKGVGR